MCRSGSGRLPRESILGDLQAQKEAKEAQEMANGMVNDDEIVLLPADEESNPEEPPAKSPLL